MKIYHFPYSPNSRRVLAVAFHLGLEPELIRWISAKASKCARSS